MEAFCSHFKSNLHPKEPQFKTTKMRMTTLKINGCRYGRTLRSSVVHNFEFFHSLQTHINEFSSWFLEIPCSFVPPQLQLLSTFIEYMHVHCTRCSFQNIHLQCRFKQVCYHQFNETRNQLTIFGTRKKLFQIKKINKHLHRSTRI